MAFQAHLAETLYDLGYTSTKADSDVWIRPATKPDGFKYYEILLVYVDDVLCISHHADANMAGTQGTILEHRLLRRQSMTFLVGPCLQNNIPK